MTMPDLTPASIAATCTCLALRRAARGIARRYDEAFSPLDINSGQFSMLMAIAGLQPVGMQGLADLLGMDRTTVTAALKPLQRKGLVTIATAEQDQRGREARLTVMGQDTLTKALPLWQAVQAQVAGRIGGEPATVVLREQLSRID